MAHRLVAPLPLSEAPRSMPRRSGPGAGASAGGGGWSGAQGFARDKTQSDRVRLQCGSHRGGGGGRDSVGTSQHTGRSVPAPTSLAEDSREHVVQSSPSPPRRYDRRTSDARPSAGTVITVAPAEPGPGSPVRQLRASKLRSPEPTSEGAATTTDALRGYPSARPAGVAAVGPFMSLSKVMEGQAGQEGANRRGRLDTDAAAAAVGASRQTDDCTTKDRAVAGKTANKKSCRNKGV